MSKNYFIKVTKSVWSDPGMELPEDKTKTGVLGNCITEFKRISEEEFSEVSKTKNLKSTDEKDVYLKTFYTKEGVDMVYGDNEMYQDVTIENMYNVELSKKRTELITLFDKNRVDAENIFFLENEDSDEEDDNEIFYFEITPDNYGKFCYLFKKDQVIYRLGC